VRDALKPGTERPTTRTENTTVTPAKSSKQASAFLPLRPVEFQILLSLAGEERHGYGIVQDAEARTGEAVSWGLGTLYRALRRLVDQGLIEPSSRRTADAEGERRNYYRISSLGRRVVTAEANRLDTLVRAARASGVLGARRV
jgi:DNA-binding PadR family transcriptional regulator